MTLDTVTIKRPPNPGHFAICRNLTGGDWAAAALLQRIVGLWLYREKKGTKFLNRMGMEWIAMSRDDWALSAGLTPSEMKNRALPRLKQKCSFVTTRQMKLDPSKPETLLWISLDWDEMQKSLTPWDMHEAKMNGQGIFAKEDSYPFNAPK
jgi:hypothetical protein